VQDLPERIRRWREHRGIAQKDFADILGVSPSAVCQWESGDTTPETPRLEAIAGALDLTLKELLFGSLPRRAKAG
jgi:transcriptional regulator with XRE-family HTH domain